MMVRYEPSAMDVEHLRQLRANVSAFLKCLGAAAAADRPARLLDIAPQVHEGARPHFPECVTVETLDIDPASGATYIADLCATNPSIPSDAFDYVICTEVLEHTLRPFDAVREMHRILKPGGLLAISVPFNFRIHGPLPDCWRFTEHGLRAILSDFTVEKLLALETPDRPLMPVHYTVTARKPTA